MKTNLLQLGTLGVDMKSNPLLLGNKKLHAATNIAFDEGVIRTRPGFRYESLGAEGQFQGACEYRPKEGLSSSVLTDVDAGIAVVADGVLWFKCNPISEALFDCAGSVNLFQAENYLILQNTTTDTFWWDGAGELVRSPGMTEQDWTEPEVPVQELNTVAPVAVIPDCDLDGSESGVEVRFLIIDHATELPISDVIWTVKRNGRKAYSGLSGDDGRFEFNPIPRVYAYDLRKDGYHAIEDIPLEINGTGVERVWDDCLPPTIEIIGDYDFVVRMYPIAPPPCPCEEDLTSICVTYTQNEIDTPLELTGSACAGTLSSGNYVLEYLSPSIGWQFRNEAGAIGAPAEPILDPCDPRGIFLGNASELTTVEVHLTFALYGSELVLEEEDVTLTGSVADGFTGTCSRGDITLRWDQSFELWEWPAPAWVLVFDELTAIPSQPDTAGPYMVECFSQGATAESPEGDYLEHEAAPFPHWYATVSAPATQTFVATVETCV